MISKLFSFLTQKNIVVFVVIMTMFFGVFSTPVLKVHAESISIATMQAQIQQLLQIIQSLQSQLAQMRSSSVRTEVATDTALFSVGDAVRTTSNLRVRAGAGANANWVNNVAAHTSGEIVDGPKYADGYTWWHVTYNSGTSGWSAQNWLTKLSESAKTSTSYDTAAGTNPSCIVSTDKYSYQYNDQVKISWVSKNTDYIRFVDANGEKDDLFKITNKKYDSEGSLRIDAQVIGLPNIVIEAVGEDGSTSRCSRGIEVKGPEVRLSPASSITVNGKDGQSLLFDYYPLGDIRECTITGHYSDGKYPVDHEFNDLITESDGIFGRAYFTAVGERGVLESVKVICQSNFGDISDSVDVNVTGDSGTTADVQIKLNGISVFESTGFTEFEALSRCRKEANDYENYHFTGGDVLECYWDGGSFYRQDAWKG